MDFKRLGFKHLDWKTKGLPLIASIVLGLAAVTACVYAIIHTNSPSSVETPPPVPALTEPGSAPPPFTVSADKEGLAGVEPDSSFIIQALEPINAADFAERLSLDPPAEFELTQRAKDELYLKPTEALRPGSVYNVLLSDNSYEPPRSWAFQTKSVFRLAKSLPAAGGRYVPVNSGIEFYFNQPVANIGAYVSISPALAGRFEAFNDTTVVFIPGEDMQYDCDYTVTLAANLPSLAGDTLEEETSFTFHTDTAPYSDRYYFYPYDGLAETFTSSDPIYVKLYADEAFESQDLQVDIYRYTSLNTYLQAESGQTKDKEGFIPTTGLNKISDFSSQLIINKDLYWRQAFLTLPENPGPGWYLVDMRVTSAGPVQDQRAQKLLQITDIAVYAQTANNQLLLWLNNAASGQALAGAKVTVAGQSAVSDAEGVVIFDVPPPPRQELPEGRDYYDYYYYYSWDYPTRQEEVRVRQDDLQYGAYLDIYGNNRGSWAGDYYTYVYTDRQAYQPDDTLRFWGMILPRRLNAARPRQIKLEWTGGGQYPDGVLVDVRADGSFTGEVRLNKQVSGWDRLYFTLEDKMLVSAGFSVLEYVKPVYTATMTLDKPYYRKGDTIQALAEVSFYDGTPGAGINVSFDYRDYSSGYESNSKTLTTNENGRCQANFPVATRSSWQPTYNYVNASSQSAEEQTLYFDVPALVFPSDYMAEPFITQDEEGLTVEILGHAINYASVDSGEFQAKWDSKLLRGQAAELDGQFALKKVEYKRKKTGEFYDFINKRTIEQYEYEKVESTLGVYLVTTENGRYVSPLLPYPAEKDVYYYIELGVAAPDGQRLIETCYAPGYRYLYDYSQNELTQYYAFRQDFGSEETYTYEQYGDYYFYNSSTHAYHSINSPVELRLSNQEDIQPARGRMLYTVVGQKTLNYSTGKDMAFELPFLPEYAPNIMVMGAYFDGKHIFTADPATLLYYYPDSELTLEVKADKDRYRPGEQATLQLFVSDKNGQGQAAQYLISVADEAAFAVLEQTVTPLGDIYSQLSISYEQYASYRQPYDSDSGAESGEGDAGQPRREFLDTAAFVSGQTDANGQATLSVKLADNITSWRVTSIAFCEQAQGGSNIPLVGKNISNITAGLPFFINPVVNSRYLAGEDIGLSLRGAGSAISTMDKISYNVRLSGPDVDISQRVAGAAADFSLLRFDPLPAGSYTLLVEASSGAYQDAIELPIEVVESRLSTKRQLNGDLIAGLNISPRRFPVLVTLYDTDNTLYYNTLYALLNANGQTADQALARALAGRRLNELEGRQLYPEQLEISAEEETAWRNGLRLLPYAETDPLLTAKAVAVGNEFLDTSALSGYFREIIANKESAAADICAAYMGLAALREPVLLELRSLLAEAQKSGDFALEDRLHLAIGLALLGDHSAANAWYEANLRPMLREANNELSFAASGDAHYDFMLSAEAAMLTMLTRHDDHRGLLTYLSGHSSPTYTPLLELAAFISAYAPRPGEGSAATISYQLNGKTVRFSFDQQRQLSLELGETQLAEAAFTVENGHVSYSACYFGGLEEAEKTLPPGVSVQHKISADSVKLGEIVTVTTTVSFDDDAPAGYYQITQIVPSGLRFKRVPNFSGYSYDSRNWYYQTREMGQIDFYIFPQTQNQSNDPFGRQTMPASITFSYEAQAVLPGEYIMEADAISYSGSNILYAGERSFITVKP